MSKTRIILLALLALAMALGIWLTWGSALSAILVYCLISAGSALLLQRFVLKDRDSDYFGGSDG